MQTPMQFTFRTLILTVVSVVLILGMNITPADDMRTFVLALDDDATSTTKIEYTGIPGQIVKGQIVIFNPSKEVKKILVTLGKIDQKDINENNLNAAANLFDCCQQWVVLPRGDVYTIAPQKKAVIPYELRIPQDAEAKNYYGAFLVNEVDEKNEPLNTQKHHNLVMLNIKHTFSPTLGMLTGAGGISDTNGASEINIYSPLFAITAALMLALGIALLTRWCLKKFKV